MRMELITNKQAMCMLILFIMGSTLLIGIGGSAKNDAWISLVVSMGFALPVLLVYIRILALHPGKELFEILDLLLGKYAGKAVSVVYSLYALHLGALVLRNFGEFVNTSVLPETPILVPMLGMGILCIIGVKLGLEVLGRFSVLMLPILITTLSIVQILALSEIDFENLKPVLENGWAPVLDGAFSTFSFPFAETVLFLGVLFSLKNQKSTRKVFLMAFLIAGTIIFVITIRNIGILGNVLPMYYFPSYASVGKIGIGNFLQRIEVTVAIVLVTCVFIKSSVCLYVAGKGLSNLVGVKNYRSVIVQLGLLMVYISYSIYDSSMEMRDWAFQVYPYYAFPMQVILPLLLLVIAESKRLLTKQK